MGMPTRLTAPTLVVQGSPFGFDTCDEFAPWPTRASKVETTKDERDSFMSLEMGGWYTRNTTWTRSAVLLREGPLIVLDSLVADEDASGYAAGPVWHMVVKAEPSHGMSGAVRWYNSYGFMSTNQPVPHINNASQLLVMMTTSSDEADQGVSSRMLWGPVKPWSLFTKVNVQASGVPLHFLSVLVPHNKSAETIAQGTHIHHEVANIGAFSVALSSYGVKVSIATNGSWDVVRQKTGTI